MIKSDLHIYLDTQKKRCDQNLKSIINHINLPSRVVAAMEYMLLAGGKRLRPILCMASADVICQTTPVADVIQVACAIEMIHTYSLIHDDLPAMDNDKLRRGQPTCHIKFDEATAILAGDALLTYAFQLLSATALSSSAQPQTWFDIIHKIAFAAGCQGMIEGQSKDMQYEGTFITLDNLKSMHYQKTGALIEAAVVTGALLAGATSTQISHLQCYAQNIGLGFQVADDILNVTGDPEKMGKEVGTDAERGKNTYPGLMGLENAQKYAKDLIDKAINELQFIDNDSSALEAIASYIIERNK